ncbi:MAG: outer membrane protein [Polaromonas sp.]|nr:outer membrane protein [Polaromonas sp.]
MCLSFKGRKKHSSRQIVYVTFIFDASVVTSCSLIRLKALMKISSLVTVAVLGLTGTAAIAQAVDTRWYIAPTVGITLNDSDRQKNTGGAVGLAIGKVLNDKWNVEFGGQYMEFHGRDGIHDRQANIGVDGLYFFNRNPDFAPYALMGLAYVREGSPTGRGKNDNLMAKVGLGFTKKLTENIDFRTDARYQWHGNKTEARNLGDFVITAGLNIAFGGKTQAPAPYVAAPAYVAEPVYVAPAPVVIAPPPAVAPVEMAPAPYVAPTRAPKQERN